MHLLIDGDGPMYRAAAAAQHNEYHVWEGTGAPEEITTFRYKKDAVAHINNRDNFTILTDFIVEEEHAAIHNIRSLMGTLLSDLSPRTYTCFIGGDGNYRHLVNPEYKAGRSPRPVHYNAVKEYLIKNYNVEVVNGYEADDACSMAQWRDVIETHDLQIHGCPVDYNTCIASNDKDLLMVPGNHYNWVKKEHQYITVDQGDFNFYIQLCTGDSTDNIHGLKGIGPAKAAKILKGCTTTQERYEAVRFAYEEAEREDIEEVARQIWMSKLTPDDWRAPE